MLQRNAKNERPKTRGKKPQKETFLQFATISAMLKRCVSGSREEYDVSYLRALSTSLLSTPPAAGHAPRAPTPVPHSR